MRFEPGTFDLLESWEKRNALLEFKPGTSDFTRKLEKNKNKKIIKGIHCRDLNQGPLGYRNSALTSRPRKHHS